MKIKINETNRKTLETEMKAVQARGQNAMDWDKLSFAAREAEEKLEGLNIPKKARSGARYYVAGGEGPFASSYRGTIPTTLATLQRGSDGSWFLIGLDKTEKGTRARAEEDLYLTDAQDAAAVTALRRRYSRQQ